MPGLTRRLLFIGTAIILTLTVGTIGFVMIEGFEVFDAFYMSLITITTVGYAEIQPLSRMGRIFNSALLLFSVATMLSMLGVMTQTIIELELGEFFGRRRVKRMIENLEDHYIVCGFGRVGQGAAEEGSELASRSLMDMQLRRELDVIVLAIRKAGGSMRFNPPADAVIDGGDHLVVMGNLQDLAKLAKRMGT